MYADDQSIQQFQRQHARDVLAEQARHLADEDEARLLGGHLAFEREAQRLMVVAGGVLVLALLVVGYLALTG